MNAFQTLQKLNSLGFNIAEILCYLPVTTDADTLIKNEAIKQWHAQQAYKSKIKTVLRDSNKNELSIIIPPSLIRNVLREAKVSEDFLLLKYPNQEELFNGWIECSPVNYHIRIVFPDSIIDQTKYWNDHCNPSIAFVRDDLRRAKEDLAGLTLLFSYFGRGAGTRSQKLMYWGI